MLNEYRLNVVVSCTNDSFGEDCEREIRRILSDFSSGNKVMEYGDHPLKDSNGNTVGKAEVFLIEDYDEAHNRTLCVDDFSLEDCPMI